MSACGHGIAVVKVGGGLLTTSGALQRTADALAAAAGQRRLVIVPGGGPFADAVRTFDEAHGLSPAAAHWMAILAQDQFAHVLAERVPGAVLAWSTDTIAQALVAQRIPVLAPSRWMLAADVLPHQWDATGDSVAAFVAGALDAELLVLVKPVRGTAGDLADASFSAALPADLPVVVVGVGELERLTELLRNA